MTVSLDGVETYEWPVSTGKAGYSTPSGTYSATSMNEIWYSKQWDNAPMPHSIFFMKDGHAIHGSLDVKNLGKPVSHGCVRISPENAATLYELVDKNDLANTRVVLTGVTPGGEYKVARQTIDLLTVRRVPAGTSPATITMPSPGTIASPNTIARLNPSIMPSPRHAPVQSGSHLPGGGLRLGNWCEPPSCGYGYRGGSLSSAATFRSPQPW